VSSTRAARTERFNRLGPWYLIGITIAAVVVYAAVRNHSITREEILYFVVLVPSIVLHEISHGAVANLLGDDTAKRAGRLTLNPLRHIDPIGTVLLPIFLLLSPAHTAFGWAKPVPVSINRLRHPRNGAVVVGLVGPVVNIVLALAAGSAFRFATHNGATLPIGGVDSWHIWQELLYLFGYVNVIIATFNLIPIPPLDGSAVVERLLPESMLAGYYRIRSLSVLLVLFFVIFAPSVLDTLFNHAVSIWANIVFS
jgi:Zn-dependent protease